MQGLLNCFLLFVAGVIAVIVDAHFVVVFMLFFWCGFFLYHIVKEPER